MNMNKTTSLPRPPSETPEIQPDKIEVNSDTLIYARYFLPYGLGDYLVTHYMKQMDLAFGVSSSRFNGMQGPEFFCLRNFNSEPEIEAETYILRGHSGNLNLEYDFQWARKTLGDYLDKL
jgi:hypothetical protein